MVREKTRRMPGYRGKNTPAGSREETAVRRFLVIDDHPLFREALQSALRLSDPDAEILEATSIEGALDMLDANPDFDLALLDLSLPGTTGLCGLVRVRTERPRLPVVVVSGHEDPRIVREALSLGIAGYIPKSTSKRELAKAIGEVLDGSVYVPEGFAGGPGRGVAPDDETDKLIQRLRDLTPQQLRVLEMLREGLQNKQIAYALKVGETTVKAHVSEILRKLNVYSRTKAVIEVSKIDFDALAGGKAAARHHDAAL
jgi:DNA-binding NarL/FixJ family response regulator